LVFASLLLVKILEVADGRLGLGLKEINVNLLGKIEGMRVDFPES